MTAEFGYVVRDQKVVVRITMVMFTMVTMVNVVVTITCDMMITVYITLMI